MSKNAEKLEVNQATHSIDALEQKIRGSLNKFPDFFHMGTFIDSTHMKL